MDQNQYSDAAYEAKAQESLRSLTRHILIVLGFFLFYCAGFVSAMIVAR
jgi:hypothetical protein